MARQGVGKPSVDKERVDSAANGAKEDPPRKLRILCLHSFRSSGKIMAQQVAKANWAPFIDDIAELIFMDAPWPATGKSVLEKQFSGPYFEWLQWRMFEENNGITGLDKATSHFSDFVSLHGPFDGLLGFSQGAVMAAAWVGFYERGMRSYLPNIKFLILVAWGLDNAKTFHPAGSDPIKCPSIHFIGDRDPTKENGESYVSVFKDQIVIRHPFGHLIPKLGAGEGLILKGFLVKQLQDKIVSYKGNHPIEIRSVL